MLISKRKKPKFKGFTLVELVIVIAVIAILASVLIPTFANIIKTAKESARYQQARSARDEYLTIAQDPEYLVGTLITLKDGYYIVGDNLELIDINIDDYDINGYDIVYNVNDVSIYKKKDSIACKIVFIANDGIVSPNYSMLYIKENTKIFYSNGLLNIEVDTLPIATKNKEGYNFLFEGWIDSLDSTYTTVIDKNGTLLESKYFNAEGCYLLSKDLTLYAKYSHTLVNYSIDYDLQGGSFTGDYPKNYNVESEDFNLVEPEKEGYNFIGWTNTEIAEPQKEVTIAKGTTKNLQFKANYEAKDIQLNVEYYLQNETLSGYDNSSEYAQIETVKFNTNGQITPKSIEGFTYNSEYPENKTEYTVTTESPITLKVYYNRNAYNIEYVNGITNEKITASEENSKYVYNVEKVINFEPIETGYNFKSWTNTTTGTNNVSINGTEITIKKGNKETLTFKANYEAKDIQLNVEYYLQNETLSGYDNSSEYAQIETVKFNTNGQITPKSIEGFTYNSEYPENKTEYTVTTESPITLKVYYNRNTYNIEYVNGITNEKITASEEVSKYVYNVEKVINFEPKETGYNFKSWTNTTTGTNNVSINGTEITIKKGNKETLTFKANYEAKDIQLNVEYYLQNETLSGYDNSSEYAQIETVKFNTNGQITPKSIEGFIYNSEYPENKTEYTVTTESPITLKVYYNRNAYNIEYVNGITNEKITASEENSKYVYNVEKVINFEPTLANYKFKCWTNTTTGTSNVSINGTQITINTGNKETLIFKAEYLLLSNINYNLGRNETTTNPTTYTVEDTITLTDAVKEGDYQFIGWYTNNNNILDVNKVTNISLGSSGDISLYPAFSYIGRDYTYGVYYSNGISVAMLDIYKGSETDIEVPKYITTENYEVVRINGLLTNNTAVTKVVIPNTVTSIVSKTFSGCTNLESVEIPDSVVNISGNIFTDCTKLQNVENNLIYIKTTTNNTYGVYGVVDKTVSSVVINNECKFVLNEAFKDCVNLDGITLTNKILSLGDSVFENCTTLPYITIPNSITQIPKLAFKGCTSLSNVVLNDNISYIGDSAFNGCELLQTLTIPSKVTELNSNLFSNCTALSSIIIPNNIKEIKDNVFSKCTSLTDITIPESVTKIYHSVFEDCTNLKNVDLRAKLTYLGSSVFNNCTSLQSEITIPEGITKIPQYAFANCSNLTKVNLHSNVTEIGNYAFQNTGKIEIDLSKIQIIGEYAFNKSQIEGNTEQDTDGTNIKVVRLDSAKNIMQQAFSESKIKNLVLLNVYKIGDSAFKDCSELISVDITSPDSGSYNDYDWKEKKGTTPVAFGPLCNDSLFENCTKLSIVDLSESKGQTIGKNAFANCGNIISISLPIRLEVIYEKAFYNSLNIERLELPRFLTVIQQNAFAQSIIENVVIATSEISRYTLNSGNAQTITLIIGLNAFQCVNLQYVIIESKGEEVASNVYNSFTSSIQVLTVSGTSFSSLKAKTVNVQSSSSSSKSNITLMSASNSNNIVPLGTGGGGSSSSIKFFVRASMSSIIHQALMRAGIKQVSASSTSAQKVANQLYTYYDRKDTASSNLINETNYWLYWTYIFNGSVTDVDIYCSVSYNRTKKEVGWKKWNDISSTDIVLS